ncbi:MAG: Unknown protein [uncultured Sulfurovum sp.]|uniref:Uncharacterized protein n=1 Tax=uncultured Sulfurovum sp. TaxID=269237 RepID=A0A6S6SXC8_9BACT|nr:MAG: Unknown protein [uncultured Sulfurovum sp.]
MEPVTATFLSVILWEALGEPLVDKVKERYSEKVMEALSKLNFNKKDAEIIEAEIMKWDQEVLENKDKFSKYIEQNSEIQNVLKQSSYIFNEKIYGNIIDKVESGATVNTTYNINHPN